MRGFVTWLCLCCFVVVLLNTSVTSAGPLGRGSPGPRGSCTDGKCVIEVPVTAKVVAPAQVKVKAPPAPAQVKPAETKHALASVKIEAKTLRAKAKARLARFLPRR